MSDELDKKLEGGSPEEVDAAYQALNLGEVSVDDPDLKNNPELTDAVDSVKKPKKGKKGLKADVETSKKIATPIATSKKVAVNMRRRFFRKLLLVILAIALLITSTVYIMLLLIEENSMRIYVGQTETGKSLRLASDSEFTKPTAAITVIGPRVMDNITYSWLFSKYGIDETTLGQDKEGSFSGDNYIAHTFFLQNNGDGDVNYYCGIRVLSEYKDMSACIRVMVVKNGNAVVYAKRSSTGGREMISNNPDSMTTPFYNDEYVMYAETNSLAAGEVDKYTLILWIEGEDPETTNERLGGYIKMEMEFGAE